MPSVRRGLNDRVQLRALEAGGQLPRRRLSDSATSQPATKKAAETPAAETPAAEAPAPAPSPSGTPETPEPDDIEMPADPLEKVRWAALLAAKGLVVAFGVDALLNPHAHRFAGKAMRVRAIGYLGALCIVPLAWRLLPDRGRYPRGLDTAVTIPLLLDAAGNGLGIYEDAHVDDVVHFANAAIVAGVAGALISPRVEERWHAALAAAGLSIVAETFWEIMEYTAMRLGADGLDLTYEDTMDDLIESALGAIVGGLFTLTRVPESRQARKRVGWRSPLGA